jgi:hypothetical protein
MKVRSDFDIAFVGVINMIRYSGAGSYAVQTALGTYADADAKDIHSVKWFNRPAIWQGGSIQIGSGGTVPLWSIVTKLITFTGDSGH